MVHVLLTETCVHILPRPADVAAVLVAPPAEAFALVWATSRKRHAWLRAERCDSSRIVVGTDDGPVVYVSSTDRSLLDAVSDLLAVCGREAILTGAYPAHLVSRAGTAWWNAREAIVAARRPSALLSMLCAILPRPEALAPTPGDLMLDPADEDAVHLLASIASGSTIRSRDGLAFWRGVFRHRVRRFARLPLPDMASRLLGELRVEPHSPGAGAVAAALRDWPSEQQEACAVAIRERSDLLVVLAYDHILRARTPRETT